MPEKVPILRQAEQHKGESKKNLKSKAQKESEKKY